MIPNPTLLTELALPAYAGMDTAAKDAAINLKNIIVWHTLGKGIVVRRLIALGLWGKIEGLTVAAPGTKSPGGVDVDAVLDAHGNTLRTLALTTKTYYTSADEQVDAQDPDLMGVVAAFAGTGVYTAQNVSDFYALFQTLISRAEQLGGTGTVVSAAEITAAEQADAYTVLRALVDAPWNEANDTRNARVHKLDILQAQGTVAPGDVAALDALTVDEVQA